MRKAEIAVGEIWFIKLPGASALSRMAVIEFTPICVQLRELGSLTYASWYERRDLKFVERISSGDGGEHG